MPSVLRRTLVSAAAISVIAITTGAGGDGPRSPLVVLTNNTLSMPSTLDGPSIDMTIRNDGTKAHELAVAHVKPGTTVAEFLAAIARHDDGEPSFELDDPGGVSLLGPHHQVRYRRQLTPGFYVFWKVAVGIDPSEKDAVKLVRVTNANRNDHDRVDVDVDGTLRLGDEAVSVSALTTGRRTFAVTNVGTTLHEVIVVGLRDAADIERADQLGAWLEGGQVGAPPFAVDFPGSHQTIEPGVVVFLTWYLKPSTTYVFVDPQTGVTTVSGTS